MGGIETGLAKARIVALLVFEPAFFKSAERNFAKPTGVDHLDAIGFIGAKLERAIVTAQRLVEGTGVVDRVGEIVPGSGRFRVKPERLAIEGLSRREIAHFAGDRAEHDPEFRRVRDAIDGVAQYLDGAVDVTLVA